MTSRDDRVWERGWAGHQEAQLRRLAELSLAEKLKWLEQAQQSVRQFSRSSADAPREGDR